MFEGDSETMLRSLKRISELPKNSLIFPGYSICVIMHVCVCVCVCVRERERERVGGEVHHQLLGGSNAIYTHSLVPFSCL